MPHFLVDCSEKILELKSPKDLMKAIHQTALETELFDEKNIKVRINPYQHFSTANSDDDFIHIFGNIMQGRNEEQKKNLSHKMVKMLKGLFPELPVISMNIIDFEKATYCNLESV